MSPLRWAIALLGLSAASPAAATEIWTGAGVSTRVADPFSVEASGNWRLAGPPMETDQIFGDVSPELRLHDNFRFGVGYRFGTKAAGADMVFAHRLVFDPSFRFEVGDFRIDLRERYQIRLASAGKDTRHTWRQRLRLIADLDLPVRPGIGGETFVHLGDGDQTGNGVGLDKIRWELLLRIPVGELDIDPFYKIDQPIRETEWSHILGLGLTYNLDLRPD